MERGWRGLSGAKMLPKSPLIGKENSDLWITSRDKTLRGHLKAVVAKHNPRWYFAVVTDTDLMDAWLHRIPSQDLRDADIMDKRQKERPTDRYTALVDLVEPPDLLIIRLGVKVARNSAMPEVLLETLHHRAHLSKFTWIVDHPDQQLAEGHISWDPRVGEFLSDWAYIGLKDIPEDSPIPPTETLSAGPITPTATTPERPTRAKKETKSILNMTDGQSQESRPRQRKKGGWQQ
jgi:hypothetical protein